MEIGPCEDTGESEKLKVHMADVPTEWLANPHGVGLIESTARASVPAVLESLVWALDGDTFSLGVGPEEGRMMYGLRALIAAEAGGHLPFEVGILAQQ